MCPLLHNDYLHVLASCCVCVSVCVCVYSALTLCPYCLALRFRPALEISLSRVGGKGLMPALRVAFMLV